MVPMQRWGEGGDWRNLHERVSGSLQRNGACLGDSARMLVWKERQLIRPSMILPVVVVAFDEGASVLTQSGWWRHGRDRATARLLTGEIGKSAGDLADSVSGGRVIGGVVRPAGEARTSGAL
jgi:hypothetical protein